MKITTPLACLSALILSLVPIFAYDTGCGNHGQNSPPPCEPSCGEPCDDGNVGSNPINPYRGNLIREVTDLQTYGAAPIKFTRLYNSRTRDYTKARWELGTQYTWQHNWQYEVRESSQSDFGFPRLIVRYPEGREYYFRAVDASGSVRVPDASWGDRLYPNGTNQFILRTPKGQTYEFRKVSVSGGYQYLLDHVRNGTGWRWSLTYQQQSDGLWRLHRVTNNYGRFIQLNRTASTNGYWRITSVSTNDGRLVTYNYQTWNPTSETVLTGVTYPGGESAQYTWAGANGLTSGAPVLASASDPLYPGAGSRMKYLYNYTAAYFGGSPFGIVNGTILEERSLVTDKVIVSLPLGSGNYPQVLQGNGVELTRKYTNGLPSELRDGEGRTTTLQRSDNGFGYVTTRTAPGGHSTTFQRDFAGRILSQTNPLGASRQSTYNTHGFVLSETDELGRTTTYLRDANNRVTRIDFPDGTYETFTYTGTGLLKTKRLRNAATETWNYDSLGNLTSFVNALGQTTTYTYTASGLLSTATDPRGHVTSYQYNWRGLLTRTTFADGSFTENTYDPFGNQVTQRNELAHIWTHSYNEYNQRISTTDPLSRTTHFAYGKLPGCSCCSYLGTPTRITLPSGKKIENSYDSSGKILTRTIGAETPEAATTTYTYDSAGRVATETDPRGFVTTYTHDALGRLLSTTNALGHLTTRTYDAVGNVILLTFPDSTTENRTYDSMNRLLTTKDALNQTTTFTYHPDGSLASLKDAKNQTYTFQVDALSRRTKKTYPGGSFEQWTYDGNSNVLTYRTRAGAIATSTYNNRDRETLRDWNDATPDVTMTYDAAGRLITLSNIVASSTYTYDAANQLLSESMTISGLAGAKTVSYAYDVDGNRASLTDPSGSVTTYTYTARNEVASVVADGPPPLATFTYDLAGNRLSKNLENGVQSVYSYDALNRLTQIAHQPGVETLSYTYDSMSRRTNETRSSTGARNFGYDPTGQLLQVTHPAGTATFSYDAVGNRLSVIGAAGAGSYSSNVLNQYTSAGGLGTLTYDANGNLASGGGWTYSHNSNSRLISANGPSGASASFGRDARNREVKRTLNGVTTYHIYDEWNLVAEYNSTGTLTTRYIHGPRVDEILAKVTSSGSTYPLEDGLGSTIAVTSPTGAVLERISYTDAYGTPTFQTATGTPLPGTTTGTRFLFTGREWLAELGLYDYRNRTYSPTLGRFLQTDPIRFDAGDVNLYRYVSNNPVNWVDPEGLQFSDGLGNSISADCIQRCAKWCECVKVNYTGCMLTCIESCENGEPNPLDVFDTPPSIPSPKNLPEAITELLIAFFQWLT